LRHNRALAEHVGVGPEKHRDDGRLNAHETAKTAHGDFAGSGMWKICHAG
jgi:hypothetical protein